MATLCFFLALGIAGVQDDPADMYKRGLAFYNAGRYEEALELLKSASAFRPNVPDYRFSLGLTYLKLGQAKQAAYELEAVRGMIGLRRNTRVKEPQVLVHLATAFIQLNKLSGARSRLELALEQEPDNVPALYALGLVEQKEGNTELAFERFQMVLKHEPDHPDANLAVAKFLREQGRGADALERLRHAAHGAPGSVQLQLALGAAAYEQGFPDEAEAAFQKALALEPQNAEALFGFGTLMLAKKQYDAAITTLEPLTRTETPHDPAAFNLAQAYMAKDRKEEALGVLEALATRSPEHPKVQFTLALVFEIRGEVGLAEAAYRREIQVQPDFVPAYLNLAALLEKEGRSEEAVEQLRLALVQSSEASQAEKIQAAITAMEESE